MEKFSAMDYNEEFKFCGSLSLESQEQILDELEKAERIRSVKPYIQEAKGCFVSEDCLQEIISHVSNLHFNLRKSDTKDVVKFVLDLLEDKQNELRQEGEYGKDELKKALKEITGEDEE